MSTVNGYTIKPKDRLLLKENHTYFICMDMKTKLYCYPSIPYWARIIDFIRRLFHGTK